ncbi:hypothetical protein ACP4OV_004910 [Aristida adscensionis]
MASSSSTGGAVPEERAAVALNDVAEAHEGVTRLRSFLLQLEHRPPWAEQVADGVLDRLSSAMTALDVAGAAAGSRSPATGSDGAGREQQSARSARKRRFSRRSQGPSERRIMATLDDGHIWRKYGQKEIQNSPHPRSYYRCTHKSDQGCNAKRHVQLCDTDPSKHVVTYYGEHTCGDPSTVVPFIVHAAGAAPDVDGGTNNLISFTTSGAAPAVAATSSQLTMEGSVTRLSSSSWCTSDDVFSSSAGSFMQVDELAAVVGSAGVTTSPMRVGSAPPDRGGLGDMPPGRAGAGSFPSSPNSLGFMVGSLGSIDDDDDDDFFRLGP